MPEIIANIHIHSVYSDGLKSPPEIARIAAACDLDAIIITDHNVFPRGFDGYYTHEKKKVLLITGEEIHDQNRQPQKNHLLAIGISKDFSQLAKDPQRLISAIQENGGLSFLAHVYDPALPLAGEDDLSWVDWSIHGFNGLELWNNLSEFKVRVKSRWQLAFFALFPQWLALEPPKQIRTIWDSFLVKGQKVVAIGGSDAHTIPYKFGPIKKDVFPYRYHFRSINNHILLKHALSGDPEKDIQMIIGAMREGTLFIAYDRIKPSRGFRFNLKEGQTTLPMGSGTIFKPNQKLVVEMPFPAHCRLVRNGVVLDEQKVLEKYTWKVNEPGIYRVECTRRFLFKRRGWIYSNPIYIQ